MIMIRKGRGGQPSKFPKLGKFLDGVSPVVGLYPAGQLKGTCGHIAQSVDIALDANSYFCEMPVQQLNK